MAGRLLILMYHRVLDTHDPLRPGEMPAQAFAKHMGVLSRFFNVLPLVEACRLLKSGSLPSRAACITFDDGYADNLEVAWPILKRFGLPATVFVSTGYLDGGRMWNDSIIESVRRINGNELNLEDIGLGRHDIGSNTQRVAAIDDLLPRLKHLEPERRAELTQALVDRAEGRLPDDLMLRADQVREMSRCGIEIGAHTITHPILKSIDDGTAAIEINESRRILEEIVGSPIAAFAYPNGKPGVDYDSQHVQMVKDAGFECAVSTSVGTASASGDIFQMPRFGPWSESSIKFGIRALKMLR